MRTSTHPTVQSCTITEVFDADGLTANAGTNLLVDFFRSQLQLHHRLEKIPLHKAAWAKYSLAQDVECLILLRALGMERINHVEEYAKDPVIAAKLGVDELPHRATFYRTLDRFQDRSDVEQLAVVNAATLGHVISGIEGAILDIDTTVETVYGDQEGAEVAYNPQKPGRASYQPMIAFEGQTGAGVYIEHRSGRSPNANDKIDFFRMAKKQLPEDHNVSFVRADKAFASERFCSELEDDKFGYAIKLRMTSGLVARMNRGVLWKRIHSHETSQIEVGSVRFKASGWSRHRRVVLIRTRFTDEMQLQLFPELRWSYQAIVTNVDWEPEDVWHFYNQRCTCENYIKELKYGLDIDAISKGDFWPNAADLWMKMIAYNALLAFKNLGCPETKKYTIRRLRRVLLKVPAVLVRHARRLKLRLPSWWPHQEKWWFIRNALAVG